MWTKLIASILASIVISHEEWELLIIVIANTCGAFIAYRLLLEAFLHILSHLILIITMRYCKDFWHQPPTMVRDTPDEGHSPPQHRPPFGHQSRVPRPSLLLTDHKFRDSYDLLKFKNLQEYEEYNGKRQDPRRYLIPGQLIRHLEGYKV